MSNKIAMCVTSEPDSLGEQSFTIFWVYDGYRRTKTFNSVVGVYLLNRNVEVRATEAEAKAAIRWDEAKQMPEAPPGFE